MRRGLARVLRTSAWRIVMSSMPTTIDICAVADECRPARPGGATGHETRLGPGGSQPLVADSEARPRRVRPAHPTVPANRAIWQIATASRFGKTRTNLV